ncbi:MAG: hypothetical protein WDZ49_04655 [Litorilinea sp.]
MNQKQFGPRRPISKPERHLCPHLGTLDRNDAAAAAIDYPSFENHCLARDRAEQIILTEQATFCLAASHRTCPRFLAAAAQANPRASGHAAYPQQDFPRESPSLTTAPASAGPVGVIGLDPETDDAFPPVRDPVRRHKWSWIGAAMIFVSTLLCGGIFAVYVGWQIANTSSLAVQPGTVDTLADQPAQPQIYLVVTATSEPGVAAAQAGDLDQPALPQGNPAGQTLDPGTLPQAVTPTPGTGITTGAINTGTTNINPDTQFDPAGQPATGDPAAFTQNSGTEPLPDAQPLNNPANNQTADPNLGALALDIPTRRPTPFLDIPTSTPMPAEQTIPTPIPPPSTPMVLISAADEVLEHDECTLITWNVRNVTAVYFDSSGVDGSGEREVCMNESDLNYVLTVMYADDTAHYFPVTITYLAPTPTPTPTFTFTPEPFLTPTWTPVPPTSTPTPDVQYGAQLASQSGDTVQCSAESTCEVSLLVSNSGSDIDSIAVQIVNSGRWSAQVCRLDGVCDAGSLIIASMGPGNTALVKMIVQVPALDAPSQQNYALRAVSQGSGQTIVSNSLQLTLEAGQ